MAISYTIRPATGPETLYAYSQSRQIVSRVGCIGHLRADMDSTGMGFYSTWTDDLFYLKTNQFKAEFDELINDLRFGDGEAFLANRFELGKYCKTHPDARTNDTLGDWYAFRLDTERYTYLIRLNPNKGEYNLYAYAYRRDSFELHLENAAKGIRIVDRTGKELYRVPDGGKIRLIQPDGSAMVKSCRFVTDSFMLVGDDLIFVSDFVRALEDEGVQIEPICAIMEQNN